MMTGNFAKRVNSDETIDLICMRCFQTAASGKSEAEVHAIASEHNCFAMQVKEERYIDSQPRTF
jgi:hypothetical protein